MKKLFFFIGVLTFFVGCNQPNVDQEKSNAEAAIKGFYSAVEKFDYKAIPTFCTSDFRAFEEGYSYSNINGFVDLLKSFDGATGKINLNFVNTEVMGDMAFSIVEFDASFTKDPVKFSFKTYENYILKKVDNKWLIHYFHSTHLPDVNDKNLTSIHLLKIPENLPISKVEESLVKINTAITTIGYPDCGYKVLTVVSGKESKFNYVMLGNWKNQEVYDIIHDSELFKKVIEETSKELTDIFKDQIYVRASLSD